MAVSPRSWIFLDHGIRLVSPTIRILGPDEARALDHVAPGVFDHAIDPRWTAEFFADERHHLAVALDGALVVGMASAVHYVHPDKPPELWVNEVAVAPPYWRKGIGRQLLQALFDRGRALGCHQAWVGTDLSNTSARRLYAAVGGEEGPEPFVMINFRLMRQPTVPPEPPSPLDLKNQP